MRARKARAERALKLLDLTDLNDDCGPSDIADLCSRAQTEHGCAAAVCIWPEFVPIARDFLNGTAVRVATVANFPRGLGGIEAARAVARSISDGAHEVDLVLPWHKVLEGKPEEAAKVVSFCKRQVPAGGVLKVILETGELQQPEAIAAAAKAALDAGADFLKTSTGKVPVNATPQAAEILLQAIRDCGRPCGFKAAGGIRTLDDASEYLDIADRIMGPNWAAPGTFRFGASGLMDALLGELEGVESKVSEGY